MTDLKEQAKKIIAKGKMLNDPELINMGLEMLGDDTEIVVEKKTVINKDNMAFDISNFTMNSSKSTAMDSKNKKQPIYTGPRENKWNDDGTEGKDILTPQVAKTERNRKPVESEKILQVCEACGKREKVLPLYAREYYRCESCLLKGKG